MKKTILLLIVLCAFVGNIFAQVTPKLYKASCMVIDSKNNMFIGDDFILYKLTPQGVLSVFIDNEKAKREIRQKISYLAIDKEDNMYSTGQSEDIILKITPQGIVTNYVGTKRYVYDMKDGQGASAGFVALNNISIGDDNKLYVTDKSEELAKKDSNYKANKSFAIRTIDKYLNVKTLKNAKTNRTVWFSPYFDKVLPYTNGTILKTGWYGITQISDTGMATIAGLPKKASDVFKTGKAHYRKVVMGDVKVAEFEFADCLTKGKNGELLFVNKNTHRILKLANNKVSLVAGNNDLSAYLQVLAGCVDGGYKDGKATSALFNHIIALAYDSNNNLLILERGCAGYGEVKIRKLDGNGMISTIYKAEK
jgi:hypothetical protein